MRAMLLLILWNRRLHAYQHSIYRLYLGNRWTLSRPLSFLWWKFPQIVLWSSNYENPRTVLQVKEFYKQSRTVLNSERNPSNSKCLENWQVDWLCWWRMVLWLKLHGCKSVLHKRSGLWGGVTGIKFVSHFLDKTENTNCRDDGEKYFFITFTGYNKVSETVSTRGHE